MWTMASVYTSGQRLAIVGFGYVGLVVFVREQLRLAGALETEEEAERSADGNIAFR